MKTRTLAIEATGDFRYQRVKPQIRLTGKWLAQAGFPAGGRVQVTCPSPGALLLECVQETTAETATNT